MYFKKAHKFCSPLKENTLILTFCVFLSTLDNQFLLQVRKKYFLILCKDCFSYLVQRPFVLTSGLHACQGMPRKMRRTGSTNTYLHLKNKNTIIRTEINTLKNHSHDKHLHTSKHTHTQVYTQYCFKRTVLCMSSIQSKIWGKTNFRNVFLEKTHLRLMVDTSPPPTNNNKQNKNKQTKNKDCIHTCTCTQGYIHMYTETSTHMRAQKDIQRG